MLENNNIKLRAVEPEDLEHLYRWENNADLWSVSSTIVPYSKYLIKEYIKDCDKDIYTTKQLRLMIDLKAENKTVGCVDIFDLDVFNNRAAIGILVDNDFKQKGIGTEALQLLVEYCFSFLKLQQIYCHIAVENKQSIHLFEKVGFLKSGELMNWIKTTDKYSNVFILQLLNEKI